MVKLFRNFLNDKLGNAALATALLALPLMGATGIGLDYAYIYNLKDRVQSAADASALATAKEINLASSNNEAIVGAAKNYVFASMGSLANDIDTSVSAVPSQTNDGLTVTVSQYWKPFILHYVDNNVLPLKASATANLAGSGTICMLGLDHNKPKTIMLKENASLEAPDCGVYTNSKHKDAISVEENGSLSSGVTCTAGGYKGANSSSYEPTPITDCPALDDPLISRVPPVVGSCDHNDLEFSSGNHTLYPGTYCKGLKIKGTAEVFLKPGVYIIKEDTFEVTENASIEGENVGFYLHGKETKLKFKKETTIKLTAPKSGPLAGILIFEDRDQDIDELNKHEITSDNARLLLGTIYLPMGTLKIDSEGPIADQSAYTAIIARAIELREGPTLYLNSDYEATDVPVPEGLTKSNVYLSN